MTVPAFAEIVAAWRGLPSAKRDLFGIMVVNIVLQGNIWSEQYITKDQPEDLAVLDEGVRGCAECSEDKLLTTPT